MPKELFNGTLITSPNEPDDLDRVVLGQPSVQGSKNFTWARFKEIVAGLSASFLSLLDTPSSYSGQSGKFVKVNETEDGLDFNQPTTDEIQLPRDPSADHLIHLKELQSHDSSPFISDGGEVTDKGDGTIDITEAEVWIKTANILDSDFKAVVVPAKNIAIPENQNYIIYVDYNAGTPQFAAMASAGGYFYQNWDKLPFATCVNIVSKIIVNTFKDSGTNAVYKNVLTQLNFQAIRYLGGLTPSEVGTRNVAIAAGAVALSNDYKGIAPLNTSTGGTFTRLYVTNGVWTRTTGQTQVSNTQYNNIATGLVSISNNKYVNKFLYYIIDSPSYWALLEGQQEFNSLAEAQAASIPASRPPELSPFYAGALLVAKFTVQQGLATFASIQNPFTTTFSGGGVGISEHNLLTGLQGGEAGQYFHLNSNQSSAIIGANTPSGSNVFATVSDLQTSLRLQFDTSTTAGDPGAGKFKLNNSTQGSATEIYISEAEYDNGNIGDFLNALSADSIIGLKAIGNRSKWANYKVTSVTDNTGWWTVVMTVQNKGTDFALNDVVGVSLLGVGGGNITRERSTLVDSTNVIDLNYNSKTELFAINTLNFAIAKTITRSNDSLAEKGYYVFNTTTTSVTLTFPSDTYYLDNDARWNKTTKVLTLVEQGSYLIKETKVDSKYYLEVSQVYDSVAIILSNLFAIAGRGLSTAKKIYTSTDGQSWTADDTNELFKSNGTCVRYCNQIFLGGGINGVFGWSENGINWVENTDSGNLLTADVNDFIYSPTGAFYLAGGAQNTHSNNLLRSTDGKTWTGVNNQLNVFVHGFVNVNGTIYVCGQGTSTTILRTTDGTVFDDTLLKTVFSVACYGGDTNGGLIVLGGEGSAVMAWSDDNGANWTLLSGGVDAPFNQKCLDVKYVPFLNKWLAVGQGNAEIATSDDGKVWTPQTQGAVIPNQGYSIIVGNNIVIITGTSISGGDNNIAYSTDLTNWTGLGQSVFFNSAKKGVFTQIDSGILISPIYRFLGDSITIRRRWTSPLSKYKQVYHFNYGVEGYTSNDILSQVTSGIVPEKTAEDALIFLAVGVNDVRSNVSLAIYQSNINSIITELETLGYGKTSIIIPTTYLITDFGSGSQALMDSYNNWISGTLWVGGGTPYTYQADVYTEMSNNGGGTLLEDGIHPTIAGGLVIANYYDSIIV